MLQTLGKTDNCNICQHTCASEESVMDIYYEKQSKNSLLIGRLSHRRWCVPAKGEAPQVSLRCRRTMHIFRQMSRHVSRSKSCCKHLGKPTIATSANTLALPRSRSWTFITRNNPRTHSSSGGYLIVGGVSLRKVKPHRFRSDAAVQCTYSAR